MKETVDDAKPQRPADRATVEDQKSMPLPGSAPIKTPDPGDTAPVTQADEVPKVGSQDAPGG